MLKMRFRISFRPLNVQLNIAALGVYLTYYMCLENTFQEKKYFTWNNHLAAVKYLYMMSYI